MIEVQGHRGARALRPENTLAAFEYALEVGVEVLELDLSVSLDGHLVVTHDQHLNPEICQRSDGQPLEAPYAAIHSLTLEALKQYDCGTRVHPRFPRQVPVPKATMPTLEEVFDLVRHSKYQSAPSVRFNIETKSVPGEPSLSPPPEKFAALVVDAIVGSGFLDRCNLQSFDHRVLVEARKREAKLKLAALTSDNWVDYVAVARAVGADIISPDKAWITKDAVDQLHGAGVRVIPWTANDPAWWQRLLDLGVDGIITDDPAGLIAYLQALGRR